MSNAGFQIIDDTLRTSRHGIEGIALGYRETQFGLEWVTWMYNIGSKGERNYFWGHYFDSEEKAWDDYFDRVKRQLF